MSVAYLDHAATTPLRPEALEAIERVYRGPFGNPSGMHSVAREAKTELEEAREVTAAALGAEPGEIVFTGGGSEADNLALKGAAAFAREQGRDGVVVTAFEHHAVLDVAERLGREGHSVKIAPVTRAGIVDLDALGDALDERTGVVSVMLVNNEVGTIQPLTEIAGLVRERAPRAVVHTDAVQGVPWVDVADATSEVDLVAISAHKFGGPKGVGALMVRSGTRLTPLIDGGGQEAGRRSGTHNVAGIAGMAAALHATVERRAGEVAAAGALRDALRDGLAAALPDTWFNGDSEQRVAGNCHAGFPGVEAEALLLLLDRDGVCAAAGSSCQSGSMDPSHVLLAMGIERGAALSCVRFTLGWCSTRADVDRALDVIPAAVEQLRARSGSR